MDVLECPGTDETPDWDSLYRTRGQEVVAYRPVFTGDVFFHVPIGDNSPNVAILQHPCAIRVDGVTLQPSLLVAEVAPLDALKPSRWGSHNYKQMPLPALQLEQRPADYAVFFVKCHVITPTDLNAGERVACLSQQGVNLLMQRWVHHNSRVVISTQRYQDVTSPQYEEADMTEDWCTDRDDDGISSENATLEIDAWLSNTIAPGETRRDQLQDPQKRSTLRRELRDHLRGLRAGTT